MAITYKPKNIELPALENKTWDYLEKWGLTPIYECALETKDSVYVYESECLEMAVNGEAFGLYNAILVHMHNNGATDEWHDFYTSCKRVFN